MTRALVYVAIALLASGCVAFEAEAPGGDVQVRFLDAEQYAAVVQPMLETDCASPSCHGRIDRPLALYAPGSFRADPARTFLPEPLTDAELEHNYNASCVFVTEATEPQRALLVEKPLAADVYHGGGAVFEGVADARYRLLLAWIEGGWQ